MKSKFYWILSFLTILTLTLSADKSAVAEQQKATRLVFVSYQPELTASALTDKWFLGEVTKRSSGRINFDCYWSEILLKAKDIFPGIGKGAADIGTTSASAYNPDLAPLSGVVLPFITNKIDAAGRAFVELYKKEPAFTKEYEKNNNQKLLYVLPWAENTLWTQRPVRVMEDLKGLRIRALMGIAEALNILGASVVAFTWSEGVEGFHRGTIHGISTAPFDAAISLNVHELAKFGCDAGRMGIYALIMTTINLKSFNALPKEDRAVIEEVADEAMDFYLKLQNQKISDGVDKVYKWGKTEMYPMPEKECSRWKQAAAQKVWGKWVSEMNSKGLAGQKVLDTYKSLCETYSGKSQYTPGFELWQQKYGKR